MPLDQPDENHPLEKNMSFFEHIDELRKHLMRSILIIVILAVIAFIYVDKIFLLVTWPLDNDFWTYRKVCELSQYLYHDNRLCFSQMVYTKQNIELTGQFMMAFKIAIISGLIVAMPFVIWELWRFIKPALSSKEAKSTRGFVFYTAFLFFTGVLFCYFIVVPMALQFLVTFKLSPEIQNVYTITNIVNFNTFFVLACGLVFELPLLIYVLTRIGIVNTKFLRKNRRYAAIIIIILAGLLTPSPDFVSQLILGLPLYGLYELGIAVSRRAENRKEKESLT